MAGCRLYSCARWCRCCLGCLPCPLTLMKFMNSIWCAGDAGVKSQKLCITRDVGINTVICNSSNSTHGRCLTRLHIDRGRLLVAKCDKKEAGLRAAVVGAHSALQQAEANCCSLQLEVTATALLQPLQYTRYGPYICGNIVSFSMPASVASHWVSLQSAATCSPK